MPVLSSLNNDQRNSISIDKFIFHIIRKDKDPAQRIVEVDGVNLLSSQKKFFEDRLKEAAEGTQYVFDTYGGDLKKNGLAIIKDNNEFTKISKLVARSFSEYHKGNTSEGVFVFTLVKYQFSATKIEHLLFIVKINKQASFSYTYNKDPITGKVMATITESPNSLVEDKSAVSKSAIIDLSDEFVWDVLAIDKNDGPSISKFFKDFMRVKERELDSVLTIKANSEVRKWARANKDHLPPDENVNTISGRAYTYICNNTTFETSKFIDFVIKDYDVTRKSVLSKSLNESLVKSGVAGQKFKLHENSISNKEKQNKYTTDEGVTVIYNGDEKKSGIEKKIINGKTIITITTEKLKIS